MTRYEHGFLTKCAEYGVDGRRLLKTAKSTYGHELAGSIVPGMIPYVGSIPHAVGAIAGGLNARDLSDEEVDELIENRDNAGNYIPGVAGYRLAQRSGHLAKKVVDRAKELGIKSVRPTRNSFTEQMSIFNPLNIIGNPVGLLVGASRPHRTLDEQVLHDSKPHGWKNILVPGYGAYQSALRIGASRDVMEKERKNRKKNNP